MEGTGGLLNAGRAIIGASVGSGVAAGASTALGHSDIANVASGIIGGVTVVYICGLTPVKIFYRLCLQKISPA
jgi:hypothetical protein